MELLEALSTKFNYWIYIIIMMIGLYAMISKNNLVKKLIGMSIFQTAIILFYVSIGVKEGATIPILYHDQVHPSHGDSHHEADTGHGEDHHPSHEEIVANLHIEPDDFGNPPSSRPHANGYRSRCRNSRRRSRPNPKGIPRFWFNRRE